MRIEDPQIRVRPLIDAPINSSSENWTGGRPGRPPAGFIGISSRAAVTTRMKHEFQIAAAVAVVTQAVAMRVFLDRPGPGGFFLCGNATDPSSHFN